MIFIPTDILEMNVKYIISKHREKEVEINKFQELSYQVYLFNMFIKLLKSFIKVFLIFSAIYQKNIFHYLNDSIMY